MSETEQTWDRLPLWFTEKPITVAIGNANEHRVTVTCIGMTGLRVSIITC